MLGEDDSSREKVVNLIDSFTVSSDKGDHEVLVTEPLIGQLQDLHHNHWYKYVTGADVDHSQWVHFGKQIIYQVLKSLVSLHSTGIVHGEMIPQNVMLSLSGALSKDIVDQAPHPDRRPDGDSDSKFLWVNRKTVDPGDELPVYLAMATKLEDLDPELLQTAMSDLTMKLTGFSCAGTEDDPNENAYANILFSGYSPPEAHLQLPITSKSDIWAFGCLAYQIMNNRSFFYVDCKEEYIPELIKGMGKMPKRYIDRWSGSSQYLDEDGNLLETDEIDESSTPPVFHIPEKMELDEQDAFEDFIWACIDWKPTRRSSAEQLLKHPWIKKFVSTSSDLDSEDDNESEGHSDEDSDEDSGEDSDEDSDSESDSDAENDGSEGHASDSEDGNESDSGGSEKWTGE
jgi:serine/threonine protein kinase